MKFLFRHFAMLYHYHMAILYDRKFKKHCKQHEILFFKQNPDTQQMMQEGE